MRVILLIFFLTISAFTETKFGSPIAGKYLNDYYIINYYDHGNGENLLDFNCGKKTYKGHRGTDFILKSFKHMDSGVPVIAAEEGVVVFILDSLFDRNKNYNDGGYGNFITISHKEKIFSIYAHLKKYSSRVKNGQLVKKGDTIAFVGSSGNSLDPHLHFEVWKDTQQIDPFYGKCQTEFNDLWAVNIPYISQLKIIDKGFTNIIPDLDNLRERENIVNKINYNDKYIGYWSLLSGVKAGDKAKVEWITPKNELWYKWDYTFNQDSWYFYFWSYIDKPDTSLSELNGNWKANLYINDTLISEDSFILDNILSIETEYSEGNKFRILNFNDYYEILTNEKMYQLDIFNIRGELLKKIDMVHNSIIIRKDNFNNGILILRLIDNNGLSSYLKLSNY